MDTQPNMRKSIKFIRAKGKNTALFLKSAIANTVLDYIQGLANLKVIVSQTDGTNILPPAYGTVTYSPDGITIAINPITSSGTGGGGGSTDQLYVITAVGQNTVSAGGFTIYKPLELQGGLTGESIDGVALSYSNYSPDFNTRIATDPNSNSYTQYINPRYTVGQIICARAVSTLVTTTFPSGTGYPLRSAQSTFLLEYSPSRNWGGTP